MNILVTGCNSFIAKEFAYYFKDKMYNLILTNRSTLDVSNPTKVDQFFNENKIDFVVHTAIVGGKRGTPDTVTNLMKNIEMYNNLRSNRHRFKGLINFGSGAEFDRRFDIHNKKEEDILLDVPNDYYGMSKNLITRSILETEGFYNFRVFGCFGFFEEDQRLLRSNYLKHVRGEDFQIHQNKFMDFISANNLCRLIEFYLLNHTEDLYKDINVVHKEKKTLKNLIFLLKNLTNSKSSVIINGEEMGFSYTGDASRISSYNLNLNNIEEEINECLINWRKS